MQRLKSTPRDTDEPKNGAIRTHILAGILFALLGVAGTLGTQYLSRADERRESQRDRDLGTATDLAGLRSEFKTWKEEREKRVDGEIRDIRDQLELIGGRQNSIATDLALMRQALDTLPEAVKKAMRAKAGGT